MQMRMVRQISNTDCAIAALAMVLDKNYDTVLFDIGPSLVTENGLNEMYVRKYLWENGCIIMQKDRYNLIHRTDVQKNNATLNVNTNWPPDLLDAPRCLLLVGMGHWMAAGPMSHASCAECVENNAEPTSNLVYLMYVSNNNIENLHPFYKDIMFYNTIKEQYDRFGDHADRFKADLEYIP